MAKDERERRDPGRRVVLYCTAAHDSQRKNGEYRRRQSENERLDRRFVERRYSRARSESKTSTALTDRSTAGRGVAALAVSLSRSPNLPQAPQKTVINLWGRGDGEDMPRGHTIDEICRGPESPICRLLYDLRDLVVCTSSRSKRVGAVYFVPGRCGENL
jgi:hypothetical protein